MSSESVVLFTAVRLLLFVNGFLVICIGKSKAQAFHPGVTFQPGYGFYWAHTKKVANLGAHAYGGEIGLTLLPSGIKPWHHLHHFPLVRCNYTYYHAPYNAWMGHLHALAFQVDFSVLHLSATQLLFRLGTGIGYVSRPFHLYQNPKNKVVGSHLNAVLQTGLFFSTGHGRFRWRTGLQLSHQSNGKIKSPNYGINVIHASMGFDYYFQKPEKHAVPISSSFSPRWLAGVGYSFSVKQEELPDLRTYFVSKPSLIFLWHYSPIHAISVSFDAYYDQSLVDVLNDFSRRGRGLPWSFALAPGYWFYFDRVQLRLDWGIYLFTPKREVHGHFYQRLGMHYELIPSALLVGVALKTHFSNADVIEFGFSYFPFHKEKATGSSL